ncbi:sugar kinase [uncultured Hyphomonas sp.]|jgi:2-dehydro-3-deoxygluconokinase|uniref:sugar kinase n=1 Tax=uncultured Hyphomonas sp. TaxID=225298 RepID=UPI0030D91B3B|tara:strand:- start:31310 stop:32257 length:948 start_codon:yes stop_codon:yes gene_type:complete
MELVGMSEEPRIAIIGEAMLELSQDPAGNAKLAYGGDTLNTAVYMARLGAPVDYITALGVDPYSERMLSAWKKEGLDTCSVLRHPSRLPGLYAIETSPQGERSFYYWRSESAAREFFALDGYADILDKAANADWLYLSGITLSIFDEDGRRKLCQLASEIRTSGGQVAFDPNYRPAGWTSAAAARKAMEAFCRHASIVLPTIDDEHALFGMHTEAEHCARWHDLGVDTVIMKHGPDGATIHIRDAHPEHIAVPAPLAATDTTGAGDSFNAACLAGLMRGKPIHEAAADGHRLAGIVVQHRGAIIPKDAMVTSLSE